MIQSTLDFNRREREEWVAIPGYEGYYEVSNYGQVRSVDRIIVNKNGVKSHYKSRVLRQVSNQCGYLQVMVCRDCKYEFFRTARLVASLFVSNPENKETVNHIDGNKTNNYFGNLEWATRLEQVQHLYSSGLKKIIIPIELIPKLKESYKNGAKIRDLARSLDVSYDIMKYHLLKKHGVGYNG